MLLILPGEVEQWSSAAVVTRSDGVLTIAGGSLRGEALEACLLSDWLALLPGTELDLTGPLPSAGLVWRIGRKSLQLLMSGPSAMPATEALRTGLCDAIVPDEESAEEYADRLMRGRSALAFDAAAGLVRSRGGDALERAVFAWMFATGEPQRGLAAFLEKRRPEF
jgi:enoyl-CoA hydratase/carnithine racemase